MNFTKKELKHLKDTLRVESVYRRKQDKIWIKAFEIYNEKHKIQKAMDCLSCYYSVVHWIEIQLNDKNKKS